MSEFDLSIGPPGTPQAGPSVDDVDELDAGGEFYPDDAGDVAECSPETVRNVLIGAGAALGYVVGDQDVPQAWHFRPAELDALVPPMTSIVNRTPKLRAAVARGDYMVVAIHLAAYTGRNVGAINHAKRARRVDVVDAEDGGAVEPWVAVADGHGGQPGWGAAAGDAPGDARV